jgi:protocatechuate 3,4-dioxygenase, beta subunit
MSESITAGRRQFLKTITGFGFALCATAEEPFDSLPESVRRNARRNGLVMIHHPAPAALSSRAEIAPDSEPGERLVVSGQVLAPDGRTPARGLTVYAYNTDSQGYCGDNRTEYPPRLYGCMRTDEAGRFELHTIYPGSYPGMRVPRHVQFCLWGAGYALQWVEELRFEGDPYVTPSMIAEDERPGEFRTLQRLTRDQDNVLRCGFKIRLLTESNFTS